MLGAIAAVLSGTFSVSDALASTTTVQAAGSYCISYVGSKSDANYPYCISWYDQAATAKQNKDSAALSALQSKCNATANPGFCSDAIVAGESRYTKAPNPGAGATPGKAPGCSASPTGGCIDAGKVGIPKLSVTSGVNSVVDILSLVAGILSTVFLILGAIRYGSSEGNPQNISKARLTITYAVIGVIVSILAPLIVGFVVARGPQ